MLLWTTLHSSSRANIGNGSSIRTPTCVNNDSKLQIYKIRNKQKMI
jgi:hypothetical protein